MRRYTQEYERDHRSRPYRGHMGTGLLLHTVRGPRRDQTGSKFRSGCGSAHGGSAVSPRPTEYGLKLGFKGRFPPSRTSCPQLGHAGCRPMATQNRLLLCSATTRLQTLLRRMGPVMAQTDRASLLRSPGPESWGQLTFQEGLLDLSAESDEVD